LEEELLISRLEVRFLHGSSLTSFTKDQSTMVFNNESRVENDPLREQRIAMFSFEPGMTTSGRKNPRP